MVPKKLVDDVFFHVKENNSFGIGCATGVENLYAFANTQTTECFASFYEPIMCLVLRGAKEAYLDGRIVRYSAGDTLIVSHAMPVESAIIEASPNEPYTALALRLDMAMARSIFDEIGDFEDCGTNYSLSAASSEGALIDAVHRLFQLSKDTLEAKALAPLVLREIHFRLLRAKHGGMLRQLLRHGSLENRISRVISTMRDNFRTTIPIADLASECGMSLSAFHEHFRAVTSTTPLQYQKELRLLEARRLLVAENLSVASAAFEVGYESPTQFSREYSRKFGISPRKQKSEFSPLQRASNNMTALVR
ncbi:AraC family transcriptional regulator [Pseudopelagicola sp. nBUS_19]|uniref:AraC family transcriptional regulator n=1 Tax=unclassified Pseudopelagicola TaxID=2649563 RepID=UPI003EB90C8F